MHLQNFGCKLLTTKNTWNKVKESTFNQPMNNQHTYKDPKGQLHSNLAQTRGQQGGAKPN